MCGSIVRNATVFPLIKTKCFIVLWPSYWTTSYSCKNLCLRKRLKKVEEKKMQQKQAVYVIYAFGLHSTESSIFIDIRPTWRKRLMYL